MPAAAHSHSRRHQKTQVKASRQTVLSVAKGLTVLRNAVARIFLFNRCSYTCTEPRLAVDGRRIPLRCCMVVFLHPRQNLPSTNVSQVA